ncbi:MAG: hypothetical protein K2J48_04755 [Muribaculaceae bacterium]|nr:hypothetical protein [Muribaculaceae bacterium]
MNQYEVSPKGKVGTISLLILTWFTISPLMWIINKRGKVLRANQVFWLRFFSPLTGTVFSLLFLIYGLPYLTHFLPSLADSLQAFPEVKNLLTPPYDWGQLILSAYFLPVYTFCVGVLYLAMALTGWSYIEASVYICQLGAPLFCMLLAIASIIYGIKKYGFSKIATITGTMFLCAFIYLQGAYILGSFIFLTYQLEDLSILSTREIFDNTVKFLMDLGADTHTNYICANMMVYILPVIVILLTDYLMWVAAYLCWHLEIKASPFVNRLFKHCAFMLKPLKRVLKTEFRQE